MHTFATLRSYAHSWRFVKGRAYGPANALIVVTLGVCLSGCFALERGNGVRWDCEGYVTFGPGPHPDAVATYPPGQLWVCANEDLPHFRDRECLRVLL